MIIYVSHGNSVSIAASFEGVKAENFSHKEDNEDTKSHSPEAGNCSDQSPSEHRPRSRKSTRKKPVDQTDQTVSNLVENIMKQAKEKEISKHKIWARDFVQVVDKENERSTGKSRAAHRRAAGASLERRCRCEAFPPTCSPRRSRSGSPPPMPVGRPLERVHDLRRR